MRSNVESRDIPSCCAELSTPAWRRSFAAQVGAWSQPFAAVTESWSKGPVDRGAIQTGDVIVFRGGNGLVAHRVVRISDSFAVTRGDAWAEPDPPVAWGEVVGVVVGVKRGIAGPRAPSAKILVAGARIARQYAASWMCACAIADLPQACAQLPSSRSPASSASCARLIPRWLWRSGHKLRHSPHGMILRTARSYSRPRRTPRSHSFNAGGLAPNRCRHSRIRNQIASLRMHAACDRPHPCCIEPDCPKRVFESSKTVMIDDGTNALAIPTVCPEIAAECLGYSGGPNSRSRPTSGLNVGSFIRLVAATWESFGKANPER